MSCEEYGRPREMEEMKRDWRRRRETKKGAREIKEKELDMRARGECRREDVGRTGKCKRMRSAFGEEKAN